MGKEWCGSGGVREEEGKEEFDAEGADVREGEGCGVGPSGSSKCASFETLPFSWNIILQRSSVPVAAVQQSHSEVMRVRISKSDGS